MWREGTGNAFSEIKFYTVYHENNLPQSTSVQKHSSYKYLQRTVHKARIITATFPETGGDGVRGDHEECV
jgi:hypothetical protein